VVHVNDVGSAVVAGLIAPSGIYNVGATPIRRSELVHAYGEAVGSGEGGFVSRLLQRFGGERLEPMTRSQRVSSAALARSAAWRPTHPEFGPQWLADLVTA
jgi:nucleoside-diphosphate-sugar epimerase